MFLCEQEVAWPGHKDDVLFQRTVLYRVVLLCRLRCFSRSVREYQLHMPGSSVVSGLC